MKAKCYRQSDIRLIATADERRGDKSRKDPRSLSRETPDAARKQERSSPCFLSPEARGVGDFPVATTCVNPSDFRADGATRRILLQRLPACLPSPVVSLPWNVTHCDVRTNTPTRDGHAPKRPLITSILLPLTAPRESFLLICRSRNASRGITEQLRL